jgi:hypothetical protein
LWWAEIAGEAVLEIEAAGRPFDLVVARVRDEGGRTGLHGSAAELVGRADWGLEGRRTRLGKAGRSGRREGERGIDAAAQRWFEEVGVSGARFISFWAKPPHLVGPKDLNFPVPKFRFIWREYSIDLRFIPSTKRK